MPVPKNGPGDGIGQPGECPVDFNEEQVPRLRVELVLIGDFVEQLFPSPGV